MATNKSRTASKDLRDASSDDELERLQAILLDRVDEDAVTGGKDYPRRIWN